MKPLERDLGWGTVKCECDSVSHLVSFLLRGTIRVNGRANSPQRGIKKSCQ